MVTEWKWVSRKNKEKEVVVFCLYRVTPTSGAFHLRASVYLLRTLIPSFAHNSSYHLCTFFTPNELLSQCNGVIASYNSFWKVHWAFLKNSKRVWSGNTTITNRRQPRGTPSTVCIATSKFMLTVVGSRFAFCLSHKDLMALHLLP